MLMAPFSELIRVPVLPINIPSLELPLADVPPVPASVIVAVPVDTITGQDNLYTPVPGGQAVWQVPNLILQARFIKISAQFDF